MVKPLLALAVIVVLGGCGSNETAPAETKASQVSPALTDEQRAHVAQHSKDPNFDPAESAARQRKR
jgi:hypothetical protein